MVKKKKARASRTVKRKARLMPGVKAGEARGPLQRTTGQMQLAPTSGLKNLLEVLKPDGMGAFSSLYLDPLEGGFKVSIWSKKEGLLEGFVQENEMPPLVREILFKRTESLSPGESIELIGKREGDIALIAAEPIEHPQVRGTLIADVSTKDNGEVHLKITLQMERQEAGEPTHLDVNIDHLTELFNQDIRKNTKVSEFEAKASQLVKELEETKTLTRNPKDKKTIASVSKAAKSLGSLSRKHGFVKISQLSESLSVLFDAYLENGAADKSSLPIVMQTIEMLDKMVGELSQGPDVDYLVSKISRKDSAS